ncbi:X-ray radiation resistance-associated protein 1 [Gymnogyps californianus]|uniref:X-ray radiation resistance-associated protein 1 n=1 Tax=Gymnogyps californianus TaxID=33616 RepID=UPI0021C9BF3B|nr:X-ray radiation resistance-associated protein 1 [Gymnogyps californianus]
MATTGLYKMGDGSNYATKCFPARNILRASKEGDTASRSGRWVLTRRATPRAWTEKGTTGETPQQRRKPPESASVEENNEDNVLDEPFLMKHHCLKNPSDLCSVNISSQNLVSAKEDDFEKFDCVAFINAAENLLTLEPFRKFPGLRELELSLNGLRNLKITAGDFLHLEDLDLSYNNLSPQDVWTLGDLSQLKVLRLTANGLWSLPPDLAGSRDSAHLRFPSLEVLSLDDNRLSDPSVFVSLCHLCSLKELNLDRNGISAVPYLHQAESRQFFLHPALDGDSFRAEWYKSLSSLWQRPRLPQQEDTEVPAELEAKKGQLEYVVLQNDRDPDRTEVVFNSGSWEHPALVVPREGEPSASKTLPAPSTRRDVRAPFPELKHLSLAFNKIADETALLPVAFFPCLKELTFHNNPLTTTRSGQPPLLTRLLQHNLGIKLVRQKSLATERWHFSIPLKASRKVTSRLPKITKRPLMLEAPAKTFLWNQLPAAVEVARDAAPPSPAQPLPPISSVTPAGSRRTALGEGEAESRPSPGPAAEGTASFFMTQVEDVSRPLLRPVAEGRLEKRSEQRREGSSQVVPERYKGYEELLGGDTDPDFIEPIGIQKNVQALYYILKHPLVYRDAKPQLDSMQKPYVPRKKHGRMPGPPARKTRAEILEGILMAMRNTSTITEVPLASVLQMRKSSPRAYREARRLMEEFQEVFEIPPATVGEEMARPSDEAQVVKALLAEATSKQGSPKQLQLPEKRAAKKVPKA